MIMRLKN